MRLRRGFSLASSMMALAVLAGCMTGGGGGPSQPPVTARPTGVEGEWLSSDGVAISRFTNGLFETIATDTGNKLADGTYVNINPSTVTITVRSLIRQTTSAVNCALVSPMQLNCTAASGQQFVLTRRQAV
ncbi:MAG: hypothetical protein AB7S80_03615 [Rhizobiaceae bacterium]